MKKLVSAFLLAAGLVASKTEPVMAQNVDKTGVTPTAVESQAGNQSPANRTSLTFFTGPRRDALDWTIAADITGTETPNILSELTWNNIIVYEVGARITHLVPVNFPSAGSGILFDAQAAAGLTIAGKNQDSDWHGDNRTREFSRSNNNASGGHTTDVALSVGYRFNIISGISLTPLAGYTWNGQEYKMTDGFQTIPAYGPFPGLDSKYTTDWQGRFVGLAADIEKGRHSLDLRGEYHQLDYHGEGVWNLRDDFAQDPSFAHDADGIGLKLNAGYALALKPGHTLTFDFSHALRATYAGTDEVYFSNGHVVTTRFNGANNSSQSLRVGYRWEW